LRSNFGWGEWCSILNADGVTRLRPPENCFAKARIFRPSGEVGNNFTGIPVRPTLLLSSDTRVL
jgi:hypothetical protein